LRGGGRAIEGWSQLWWWRAVLGEEVHRFVADS
jgi:hypothetical protein